MAPTTTRDVLAATAAAGRWRCVIVGVAGLAAPAVVRAQGAALKVGMITTLSGPGGYLGADIRDAFQLAIEAGAFGGTKIELVVEDDGLKPPQAKQIASRMIGPGGSRLEELERTVFPPNMHYSINYDVSAFLDAVDTTKAYTGRLFVRHDTDFFGSDAVIKVGVQFDLNLRNQTAQANLAQAKITQKRLGLEKTRAEQVIDMQVRNALQSLVASRQRITAAEASVVAAQEKLDSEIRLFQTGESTNFLVLTRQNELLESRRRAVVAQLEFNKAAARLEQAKGETLETYKITVK